MAREWAYGLVYRSHHERADALPHWLQHYNHNRPHSSLGRTIPDQPRSQRLWAGHLVGELWVDGEADRGLLERVADLLSAYALIRWDTGGEGWEP